MEKVKTHVSVFFSVTKMEGTISITKTKIEVIIILTIDNKTLIDMQCGIQRQEDVFQQVLT